MSACVHVCTNCVCMSVHACEHARAPVCMCMHMCQHVWTCECTRASVCMCVHELLCMHVYKCMSTCAHPCVNTSDVCTRVCVYMLTHLSACDHTCMSVRVRLYDLQVNVHNRTYLIKIKNFSLKDSFQNDKPHLGENFAKYVYEKEFISRIHKDPLQLNSNNTLINSAKNGQRSPCETIGQGPGPNV